MKYFFFFLFSFLFSKISIAEVNIELTQVSRDNQIVISVVNRSAHDRLFVRSLTLYIFDTEYRETIELNLEPSQKKSAVFYVDLPSLVGTYIQKATLEYVYKNNDYTLSDVGFFNFKRENGEWFKGVLGSHGIFGYSEIPLNLDDFPSTRQFHFPRELSPIPLQEGKIYSFDPIVVNRSTDYPVFASSEYVENGEMYSKIATGRVKVEVFHEKEVGGKNVLISILLFFFIIIYIIFSKSYFNIAFTNYLSKLILLFAGYLITNNLFLSFDLIIERLVWLCSVFDLTSLSEDFFSIRNTINTKFYEGNYKYYLEYVIDPLLAIFILYFTHQVIINPRLNTWPKYGLLIRELSDGRLRSLGVQSKVAGRAFILKLIFIPFLATWVVQNIKHIHYLYLNFQEVDLWVINKFALGTIFLVDSFIFLQGYCIESTRLKNNIISVDPTKLGWFVCLICYPPLNYYSFTLVDFHQTSFSINVNSQIEAVLTLVITFLWLIFVIASFNLGFKASNLTNRGVVDKGLYKYCRHPAYSSKMMIWFIQALFFGTYYLSLFLAFCIVYVLRAYTEERHLAMGKEYRDYMKKVRYRFIPGII